VTSEQNEFSPEAIVAGCAVDFVDAAFNLFQSSAADTLDLGPGSGEKMPGAS
jgi:hypothetical protein